jgi:RNA polymerase sigma-70 factor (ECF subfamily)
MSMLLAETEPTARPAAGEDDAVLLRQFVERRDREAIGALFQRHADALYRVAWRYTGNAADAEDVVQSAFIQVLRKPEQYRGESSVRAWIMGIVVNVTRMKCRGESRRRDREERVMAADPAGANASPDAAPGTLDNRELQSALLRAVETLPERYRMPVWLHYLEGFVFKDVATALNMPEKTVRSQIRRALIRLRRAPAVAPYSLGILGLAAALASVPAQAAPLALKASIPALISAVLPAAAGALLAERIASVLTAAAQLVKGGVATKLSLAAGTAAMIAGGVIWWAGQGPVDGAARAPSSVPVATRDEAPRGAPPAVGIIKSAGPAVTAGPRASIVYLADEASDDGPGSAGDTPAGDVGERRGPESGGRAGGVLPARERGAVRQARAERCPVEYRGMFEQYLRNISDEASAGVKDEPGEPRLISFKK